MAAASIDGDLTSQFQLLIQRSCSLLHHFDGLNWNVVKPSETDGHSNAAAAANGDNDNEAMNDNEENDDDQSDSSSDDGMMMFGGGLLDSDSDNEDDLMMMDSGINDANEQDDYYEEEEDGEEEEEEDDAAMLKRASSVHVALLTSLSPTSFVKDGRDLVQTLVSSMLSPTSTTTDNGDDEDVNKLITTISSVLLKSSNDYLPKRMSDERKRKIGLTNSLLTVQYLLHLLDTSSTSVSSTSSSLLGWKVVILPLLFNTNNTTKSFNDTLLQTALLNLISPSSIKMTQDQWGYCQDVCQLCVLAVEQLTSTAAAAVGAVTSNHSRQSQLILVCDVLIRLYDGMNKLLGKQQQRGGGGEELELPTKCVDSVANAIHLVIVKVIRGICYAQVEQDCGGSNKEDNQSVVLLEPLLSLEAVRPVTGMLLPKLYPSGSVGSGNLKEQQQQKTRAVELWNEILLLLSPYSEEVVSLDKRKCCRNW
eukprot:scaffold3964_cov77-Skeletonema_marinoi.AAC.14